MEKTQEEIDKIKKKVLDWEIDKKAQVVAETLGKKLTQRYGTLWQYKRGKLNIYYDDYGNNISIEYHSVLWRNVLNIERGEITKAVIHDDWTRELNILYHNAMSIKERTHKKEDRIYIEDRWQDNTEEGLKVECFMDNIKEFLKGDKHSTNSVKVLEINGDVKMVTMDKYNELLEKGVKFKDMGTKEV